MADSRANLRYSLCLLILLETQREVELESGQGNVNIKNIHLEFASVIPYFLKEFLDFRQYADLEAFELNVLTVNFKNKVRELRQYEQ